MTSPPDRPIGRGGWLFAAGLCLGGVLLLQGSPRAEAPECELARDQLERRLLALEQRQSALRASLAAESARARLITQRAERHAPGASEQVARRLRPEVEALGAELFAVECDRQPCVVAIGFGRGEAGARTPTLSRLRQLLSVEDRHDQVVMVDELVLMLAPVGPDAQPGADSARMARLLAEVMEGVR